MKLTHCLTPIALMHKTQCLSAHTPTAHFRQLAFELLLQEMFMQVYLQ
jgi:hypothetical protein